MFCHNFDSHNFARFYNFKTLHTLGEVDHFHATLLSIYRKCYVSDVMEIY